MKDFADVSYECNLSLSLNLNSIPNMSLSIDGPFAKQSFKEYHLNLAELLKTILMKS